jgi:hypothetical protein
MIKMKIEIAEINKSYITNFEIMKINEKCKYEFGTNREYRIEIHKINITIHMDFSHCSLIAD